MSEVSLNIALHEPPNKVLWDALADAEREVLKLRALLARHLCDCRKLSLERPLEPHQHKLTCAYRRSMS
jgi:hypothetical protein